LWGTGVSRSQDAVLTEDARLEERLHQSQDALVDGQTVSYVQMVRGVEGFLIVVVVVRLDARIRAWAVFAA